jgi:hypothetical protein
MSRPPAAPKLPSITVEDDNVKRNINIPRDLDDELAAYTEYFQAHSGKKPRSTDDVIVGLLNAYLAGDVLFQRWMKDRPATTGLEPIPLTAKPKISHSAEPHYLNGATAS